MPKGESVNMVWVKHDDNFSSNPKVWQLSDKAYRLHMCAIEYCARFLTDGVLEPHSLAQIAAVAKCSRPARLVDELVAGRLWVKRTEGWRIHDFLKYNRSREQVEAHRAETAKRQDAFRQRRLGTSNAVTNDVSNTTLGTGRVSKEKNNECSHCGLRFVTVQGLHEHMSDVHWDDRPLKAIDGGAA